MPNYSDAKAAASDLWKLTVNGSPRWRVIVMIALILLSGDTWWGRNNYARAGDVDGLKGEVTDIKVQLLSQSILAAHKEKCASEGSGRYSEYWQGHLQKLKNQYWQMTGQSFELPPSC